MVTIVAYSSLESAGNWNQAHCWDAAAGSGHVRGGEGNSKYPEEISSSRTSGSPTYVRSWLS